MIMMMITRRKDDNDFIVLKYSKKKVKYFCTKYGGTEYHE